MIFLFLFSAETITFYVDPIVYRSSIEIIDTVTQTTDTKDIFYMEFNCGIPYQELYYETIDSNIIANATIAFKLLDINNPDSLIDTLYRQFVISSFSEAARQQICFVVQFGIHLPEGRFRYKIEISSGNKKGIMQREIEIVKENYKISDILLASNITSDTTGDYLRKGDLRVYPHPSRLFNEYYTNLFVYYEIYDIVLDSTPFQITYEIVNKDNKIVRKISRQIEKKFKSQAVNLGLNIQNFDSGEYTFNVEVEDSSTQMVTHKEIPFKIKKAVQREVSYEGMPYYEEIEHLLTPEDYNHYQSLPKEGKQIFLKKFWNSHNYFDIVERFEHVDKYYQEGNKAGHKTDRGRIYIRYGVPDDIDKGMPMELKESRPYEHWQYFNGNQFLFIDIRGTNEYTLVWTNVSGEQSKPTLYKYIPSDKNELIR